MAEFRTPKMAKFANIKMVEFRTPNGKVRKHKNCGVQNAKIAKFSNIKMVEFGTQK
jgi:hypothetical protein